MSVESSYYSIIGYDLTGSGTDKFDDWKWTDEGERYLCNQVKDEIQLFDDPMSGMHLYLGYILACGDAYEVETVKRDINDVVDKVGLVTNAFVKLKELGVIQKNTDRKCQFIMFEECR